MRLAGRRHSTSVARPLAASLLVAVGCSVPGSSFSHPLPAAVPSLEGWESSEARAELDHPSRVVEYQLFVRPGRGATYEIIRYRISYADPRDGERYGETPNERLQWDLDGHRLRRFELLPTPLGARWEELHAGSARFARETGAVLALMGLHRKLLRLDE
jgi:hypothetical protein